MATSAKGGEKTSVGACDPFINLRSELVAISVGIPLASSYLPFNWLSQAALTSSQTSIFYSLYVIDVYISKLNYHESSEFLAAHL